MVLRSVALRCDRLVLVFARGPRDERYAKPLVEHAAGAAIEALHDRLLRRTLAVARAAGVHTRLVTTGDARSLHGVGDAEVAQQRGTSFAERLENAVADAFAAGWRHVVVIGADTPRLEAHHLRRAFAELAAARARRAVVGPACDGGYYLLALNAFTPAAFRHVPLGTPRAYPATVEALTSAGFDVTPLAPLRDVDDARDVAWLGGAGGALARAALVVLAPSPRAPTRPSPLRSSVAVAAIRVRGPPVLPSTHF